MAVSVNIPGFGEVTAQNAAQDDTLNRIVSILTDIASKQGAKVSTGSIKALDRESKKAASSTRKASVEVENLGDRSGDASSNIYGLSSAARTVKSAFADASTSLRSGKETFGSGLDIMADMLKAGGRIVQDSFKDSKIPMAGIVAGLAATASGVGAAILAMVSETSKSFQALQQAGGSFGYSLEAVRDQANMAGLRLDQFQSVFAKNAQAFAAFGGSTEQGARDFARLNKAVRDGRAGFGGVGRDLLKMGIGFEEQAEGVAESLQQFKLAGMTLQSMANPAAAVGRYQLIQARQLKILTQLNGTTMEQEKSKQKAMKDDATLQMILAKTSGDQRIALERAYKEAESLMPGAGRLMLEMFESGGPMTKGSSMFMMANQELARVVEQTAAGVKSGAITSVTAGEQMARNLDKTAMAANRLENAQNMGAAVLAGLGGEYADVIKKTFVPAQKLEQALDNVTKIFTDLDKLSEPATGMTKTMLDTLEAQQKISVALSTIMTNIAGGKLAEDIVLGPVSAGAEWLTELAKAGIKVTDGWNERLIPASSDLTKIFNDLFPDWLMGLIGKVSPAKPKGQQYGGPFDAGEALMFETGKPEAITFNKPGSVTPTNKLFESIMPDMQKMIDDMVASTQGGAAMLAGTETSAMQDEMSKVAAGMKMAGGDDGRKRDVEDAMLALPGLLMDNTDAINKANVDTTDSLDVFWKAVV